jgi:hypothetical protein
MPSAYLSQDDYAVYGVQTTTPQAVTQASALVDAYLGRREGMQYMTDYAGLPAYMAGLTASMSLTISGGIPAGANVVVPIASGLSITGSLGEAVIVDRGNKSLCEACVISAVTKTSITLANVINSHAANVTVEFGLTVNEQISMPAKRSMVRIGSWPIVRLISGLGSYRYGRRIDQQGGLYADQSILALLQTFGGPPEWIPFDVSGADFNPMTGEVWIPSGIFLAYYSDVRLYYVAGFAQANIPAIIKAATAKIILANINTADLVGGVKRAQAGGSVLERFANTILSDDERSMLDLYRAKLYA